MTAVDLLQGARTRVEAALELALPSADSAPARLHRAMRYSVLAGGKRLRPAFVYAAGRLGDGPAAALDDAAVAIELIHTYSLIHDDLPAMDDDGLRRGQPTCHVAFDEATAILAGDALLTLAFEALAKTDSAEARLGALRRLARAAGAAGMVGGQSADLEAERAPTAVDRKATIEFIHRHKTGALMAASVAMGATLSGVDESDVDRLERFGHIVGIAFQIADDLLDIEATTETLGKTSGKDAAAGKLTYPAVHGVEPSRHRAAELLDEADALLRPFGERSTDLRELGRYAITRAS